MGATSSEQSEYRIYDDEGDLLLQEDARADRVVLLPSGDPRTAGEGRDRMRILWGQHLLSDLIASRYRTAICAINDTDNTHGIIGELLQLVPTSQWNVESATTFARMFHESVAVHAPHDHEPYILKFDLDRMLIMALLRPRDRDHFTLSDLARGFQTISKMLENRRDRWPAASVSFLGAKSNRLIGPDGNEPPFESVLRTMYEAGYRGDVYPSLGMWELAPTCVFASYPFPDSLKAMRTGGF